MLTLPFAGLFFDGVKFVQLACDIYCSICRQLVDVAVTPACLYAQNDLYQGTPGVSRGCKDLGFVPAFRDADTGETCRSRFADGRPAPMHLLDGLPESWILSRNPQRRVTKVKPSVVSGFLRDGRFYTREEVCKSNPFEAHVSSKIV